MPIMKAFEWCEPYPRELIMLNANLSVRQAANADCLSRDGRIVSLSTYRGTIMRIDKDELMEEIAIHRRIKKAMREFREARHWNQQRMAQFLSITKTNYQRYETNNTTVPLRRVPMIVAGRFAEYTGMNLHELIFPKRKKITNG